jgi:N-acetylglucosaminylphosphatidylinositol deacetylase
MPTTTESSSSFSSSSTARDKGTSTMFYVSCLTMITTALVPITLMFTQIHARKRASSQTSSLMNSRRRRTANKTRWKTTADATTSSVAKEEEEEEEEGRSERRTMSGRNSNDNNIRYLLNTNNDDEGKKEQPKKVMVVIAHPDDEAMFFGPTLQALKQNCYNSKDERKKDSGEETRTAATATKVYLICLSNGNYQKQGAERAKELKKSALEVFKLDGCVIADSEDLQDGPKEQWPLNEIANVVHECVQYYSPDVIITFDEFGISRHLNHVQTHKGVMRFAIEAKMGAIPNAEYTKENIPEVYVLETKPFYRTFLGCLDYWPSVAFDSKQMTTTTMSNNNNNNNNNIDHGIVLCAKNPFLVLKAMQTHRTQWVWFRKLYVLFSRYTIVNTLRRVQIGPIGT